MKRIRGRSSSKALAVEVSLAIPSDCPLSDEELEMRAKTTATVVLATFGLTPTEFSAFLDDWMRDLLGRLSEDLG